MGGPVYYDRLIFEFLILESAQTGIQNDQAHRVNREFEFYRITCLITIMQVVWNRLLPEAVNFLFWGR